ncbi:hypothetical protein FKP32DRAFT_343969 [Trametes sanguinea]|nr:hypothetical protein FKP32DRAFT_343969 [Trametes sanguinea]
MCSKTSQQPSRQDTVSPGTIRAPGFHDEYSFRTPAEVVLASVMSERRKLHVHMLSGSRARDVFNLPLLVIRTRGAFRALSCALDNFDVKPGLRVGTPETSGGHHHNRPPASPKEGDKVVHPSSSRVSLARGWPISCQTEGQAPADRRYPYAQQRRVGIV